MVSVVIPTKDRCESLKRCLDSLLAQTYEDFEVMIVDGGSTDGTKDMIDEYSDRLSIMLVEQKRKGLVGAVNEGWGINVIEANACGTPAIAYDVPGLRDAIRDGETGLLVPYGKVEALVQASIKVLNDMSLRERLSSNALKWAANFSWDKSTQDFTAVIEKATRGG